MITLGIDPGTAHTGYGVVARHGGRLVALDGGVIHTAAAGGPGARLAAIHARVAGLLEEHAPRRWRSRTFTSASTPAPPSRSARPAAS